MNQGSCLCGAVTWELTAEPFFAYNCHCKMCRKAHGTAFATYYLVRPDQIRWTGGTDTIVDYKSSETFRRSFCGKCGAVVPFAGRNGERWAAPAGGHDRGKTPECHIFVADAAPWHDVTGDLPRHDAYPAESGFPSEPETPLAPAPDGVVRGGCLCGAVAFHVTEPIKVAHNCHCSRCRHARAAAHASNGFTAFDGVRFPKGEERLKSYKPAEARFFTQVFCDTCGSAMPRRDPDRKIAVIPLGALDDDPGIKPVDHIFVAYKAGWHDITDDLPRFEEAPPS
ncbi:MAG: GFA family protein [Pseudomonadota bacterium]